jgi:hypothetical protein
MTIERLTLTKNGAILCSSRVRLMATIAAARSPFTKHEKSVNSV